MRKNMQLLSTLICLGLLTTSTMALAASANDFRTTEYQKMGSLDYIHAADAYAKGYSGKGVTLALVDTPVRQIHPDFAGKTIYSGYEYSDTQFDWDNYSHGSHVAGIMTANKDGVGMHGVAYNANLATTYTGLEFTGENYNYINSLPAESNIKILNCSNGIDTYLEFQDLSQYGSGAFLDKYYYVSPQADNYPDPLGTLQVLHQDYISMSEGWLDAIKKTEAAGRLYVVSASNEGYLSSSMFTGISTFYNLVDKNSILSVVACSSYDGTTYRTFNGPVNFSNMAMFTEDISVTAPGFFIFATDAHNLDSAQPIDESGTSMAAPATSGMLGLVQEAYPYLTGKQLADVALSTTDVYPINTSKPTYTLLSASFRNEITRGLNIICYDGREKPTTQEGWKQLILTASGWKEADFYTNAAGVNILNTDNTINTNNVFFYNNVPLTVVFGQGVINADKATNGLGSLNAKRLTSADLDSKYAAGVGGKQALYSVNTKGYNGQWANDISETRVLFPGTGADQDSDLAARQTFYREYAQEIITHGDPVVQNKPAEVETYIAKYNAELAANPLLGLHVGLYKEGEGILRLTGNNTYQGSTVAAGGTLAVDGSVTGDAYSTSSGVLAGTGTVKGNVYNNGTLQPGTYAVNTVYDTNPAYKMGTLTIKGNLNGTGKLAIAVQGTENSKLNVQGASTLTGSSLSVVPGYYPLINKQYNYLTSQGGIIGNVQPAAISPYLNLQATVNGNNGYFTAANTTAIGNQPGTTPSENSVGSALQNKAMGAITSDPTSANAQAMNDLFYQNTNTAGRFIKDVTSEARAALLNQSPMSSLTNETVYSRLDTVDFSGDLGITTQAASLDGNAPQVKTSLPVTLDSENNVWFKLFRGFENYNYNDSLENKSFGGAIGYDHALNLSTRIGGLFSYGVTDYNTDNIEGKSHDWRLGVYGSKYNGDWEYQALATYGSNHYDIDRSTAWEGSKVNGDYKAKVWDGEVKARYFVPSTRTRTWQVKPYGKVSYTHTAQDAYAETGSSIFKQSLNSASNNSWRGEVGVELNRNLTNQSSWGGSVGYKRVISGLNPELNGTFVDDTNGFSIKSDNDRNYVTYSLNARSSLGGKWMGQAEFIGEASSNTHKEILSLTAKYSF